MKYLNIDEARLEFLGAIDTAKEIAGQPELWLSIFNKVAAEQKAIDAFMHNVLGKVDKIILTGAGTSAYIGYSAEGAVQRKCKTTTLSVPTTHLVSHPQDYFEEGTATLLVSFARSGNSPESVAAIKLADKFCRKCYHLIITCNPEGDLANYSFKKDSHVFMLPPESNDKSLAMTGSYSGMLLTILLINEIKAVNGLKPAVASLCQYGKHLLGSYVETIEKIACMPFKRAVFLGSGPQFGTATESHLKLQELTDGQVICKNDSYLGFRHGPKAVVDEETIMVYYFSNKQEVLRYELDLVNSMKEGKKPLFQVGVAESRIEGASVDELIVMGNTPGSVREEFLPVVAIIFGQLLGFFKSISLGSHPDSPSASGAISRIVKGVTIY
jgi:tagatose-6-phosphate ketose/aldose isomerase